MEPDSPWINIIFSFRQETKRIFQMAYVARWFFSPVAKWCVTKNDSSKFSTLVLENIFYNFILWYGNGLSDLDTPFCPIIISLHTGVIFFKKMSSSFHCVMKKNKPWFFLKKWIKTILKLLFFSLMSIFNLLMVISSISKEFRSMYIVISPLCFYQR